MLEGLKWIFEHAGAENFFGGVMAIVLLALLTWVLRAFSLQQREIVNAIEVHGTLLITLQLQLMADKPGELAGMRLLMEDVRKKLQGEK